MHACSVIAGMPSASYLHRQLQVVMLRGFYICAHEPLKRDGGEFVGWSSVGAVGRQNSSKDVSVCTVL